MPMCITKEAVVVFLELNRYGCSCCNIPYADTFDEYKLFS